jgi:hypothetical protein
MARRKAGSAPKPPKKKAPNIALHLPKAVQELYPYCLAVWLKVKGDTVHFPAPVPSAAEMDADLTALHDALKDAENGGTVETAALTTAADKVRQDFGLLGKYLQRVIHRLPVEDAPNLIAGLLLHQSNTGKHPPKAELKAEDGPMAGVVILRALAVAHAVKYEWELSLDQVTWSLAAESAQAHTTVQGLTPGKTYYFRFRCFLRDNTKTDPSHAVPHLVR